MIAVFRTFRVPFKPKGGLEEKIHTEEAENDVQKAVTVREISVVNSSIFHLKDGKQHPKRNCEAIIDSGASEHVVLIRSTSEMYKQVLNQSETFQRVDCDCSPRRISINQDRHRSDNI